MFSLRIPGIFGSAFILTACALMVGCTSESDLTAYEQGIMQARQAKDLMLFDPEESFLQPAVRNKFVGLRYFPIDSTFRYVLPFHRLEKPDTTWIRKQKTPPEPHLLMGYVEIPHEGEKHRLNAFWAPGRDLRELWMPFRDETSNRESYGGGRYMDIIVEPDDRVVVDFNMAYNPYCDYNAEAFNCSLPPPENYLPFEVSAGEKKSLLLVD